MMLFAGALVMLGLVIAPYSQLYVFGDSYSDTGAGYVDGNGPTAVAYLALNWGIDLQPYPKVNGPYQSLNFAVSGAQTGAGEGKHIGDALLGFGMKNQVDEFAAFLRQKRIRFEPSETLFLLAGGLNDAKLATSVTVNNLKSEVHALYALGGRHFAVALMPETIPGFAEVGRRLNPALRRIPDELKAELPGAKISLSQWGMFFDEVRSNPAEYGIDDTEHACAGRALFHQDATPCPAPDSYFYYHAQHPSTAVHKAVGRKMAAEKL